MLEEIYKLILDKVDVTAKDKFESLLRKTITFAFLPDHDPKPGINVISFKFAQLLEGMERFSQYSDKEKSMIHATKNLLAVLEGLQFEVDESECFLLYQLRKIGKFRKREKELRDELKDLAKTFPQYEQSDGEFSRSLKHLMREKIILYRKGVIQLNASFVVRYGVDDKS